MSKSYIKHQLYRQFAYTRRVVTASRKTTNEHGRPMVVDEDGRRFRVLGDQISAGAECRFGFTGERTARVPAQRGQDPASATRRAQ